MMNDKSILKQLKSEEIIDSFLLPHRVKKINKNKADDALNIILKAKRTSIDENKQLEIKLLQLKFQLEDYLKSKDFNEDYTFGFFLKSYLNILNKKNKEFADEIDVPPNTLRNWIEKDKVPDEKIFIRLEIHSNNAIPAVNWLKIIEKRVEFSLSYNTNLRQSQKNHVKNKIEVTI